MTTDELEVSSIFTEATDDSAGSILGRGYRLDPDYATGREQNGGARSGRPPTRLRSLYNHLAATGPALRHARRTGDDGVTVVVDAARGCDSPSHQSCMPNRRYIF
ncbi:hypothetical protein EVAR_27121_1 [Eumeta japonica]|uniref:Uncharacterized protein n=1 Tax=Eumeta variegata TaxID=151549 RepID=A0A4C1VYS3_EUMVA|nr:hypothetical protein EVAR_27121_1 [Eumeta japonica]